MSLVAGDRNCTTGLSKRIYDAWQAEAKIQTVSPPVAPDQLANAQDGIKAIAYAVAVAVVAEITTNGKARVDVGAGASDYPLV